MSPPVQSRVAVHLDLGDALFVVAVYTVTRALIRLAFAFGFVHILYIPAYAHNPDPWLRWDSLWYLRIASGGYHWNSDLTYHYQTAAFFPFYPLTIAALHAVGLPLRSAAVASANLAGLLFAFAFYAYAKLRTHRRTARLALVLALLFPTSLFLSAGYAASWLWAMAALALWAVTSRRYGLAALAGCIASATEATGAAVAVLLLAALWQETGRFRPVFLLYVLLALGGILGFTAYLGIRFHDPLAFVYAQYAWLPPVPFSVKLRRLLTFSAFLHDASPWSFDLPIYLLFLVTAFLATWRRFFTLPESIYVFLVLVATTWVHALPTNSLTSMARTITLALPIFLALGAYLARRRILLALSAASFATALMVFAALFGQGWWVQ